MEVLGSSNLLRSFFSKQQNEMLKAEISKLSKEVATGKDFASISNDPSKSSLVSSFEERYYHAHT